MERIERLKQAIEDSERPDLASAITPPELLKPETAASMQQTLKAWALNIVRRSLTGNCSPQTHFHHRVFLVGVGIDFSWVQFIAGMKENQGRQKASPEATIEATPTGTKVSSPGVGVIILVISLLFFYLYLVYVYPNEEIL